MILEVVTKHSGHSDSCKGRSSSSYRFSVNQFQVFPMNLKSTLVLEGNWSFVDGDFDQFMSDSDISINKQQELIIHNKMVFTSVESECKYCGSIIAEGDSNLCYDCKENNDRMYMLVREGLAYYKYDKGDKRKVLPSPALVFTQNTARSNYEPYHS